MPAFLIEEANSRIQVYDRLQNWVGKRDHVMKVAETCDSPATVVGYIELGMSAVSNEAAQLQDNVPMVGSITYYHNYYVIHLSSEIAQLSHRNYNRSFIKNKNKLF